MIIRAKKYSKINRNAIIYLLLFCSRGLRIILEGWILKGC